jgi:hypothetical protein
MSWHNISELAKPRLGRARPHSTGLLGLRTPFGDHERQKARIAVMSIWNP